MAILIQVELGERSYAIEIGNGMLARIGPMVARVVAGRQCLIATDENVGPLYAERVGESLRAAGFSATTAVVPASESAKTLRTAERLFDALVEMKADRQAVVVALGGGVIGDLAGFVAATYARGIAFVQVPTTLLAMIDASVGGKVAVDHPRAKNIIGAFHQPRLVVADLDTLGTLDARQLSSGLAEAVKHGAALDAEYFAFLEANADAILAREAAALEQLVAQSCRLKAAIVAADERETTGLRAVLNFGHTFGHAFEVAGGYRELAHGEAVSVGMICAARLAERLGRVDDRFGKRLAALLTRFGLPTRLPDSLRGRDFLTAMGGDKKARGGVPRFVLPTRLGNAELVADVPRDLAIEALAGVGG